MRDLPSDLETVAAADLLGARPVVVLAPHPDDESLGCGALLCAAFASAGARVVCMTDGSASHPGSRLWSGADLARQRRGEFLAAVERLGGSAEDAVWLGLADGALGSVAPGPVAARIAETCVEVGADRLFFASGEDHHADHKATARIAALVAERLPGLKRFAYPVWSRWDDDDVIALHAPLRPLRLRGTDVRDRKARAIDAHQSQRGRIVTDDPRGFALEDAFVAMFTDTDEIFFEVVP